MDKSLHMLLVCLLLSGCAGARYGAPFTSPPPAPADTGVVYITMHKALAPHGRGLALFVDGRPAATFSEEGEYIRLELEPGVRSLSLGERDSEVPMPQTRTVFRVVGGHNYYALVLIGGPRLLQREQGLFYLQGTALVEGKAEGV